MFTVFTCCAKNYLAHAKTLGDSVLAHNPDARFVIVLVDKADEDSRQIDLARFEVIEIEELAIPEFKEMVRRYQVYELSVAVKPFAFEYLFKRGAATDPIIFIDPDCMAFGSLEAALNKLTSCNMLFTPHALSPMDDDATPNEQVLFKYGTYNAGFVGLSPSDETMKMLAWWKKRLVRGAYADVQKGFFGDQFWLNMVPLYFEGAVVLRDRGYNVAVWNLHERVLCQDHGRFTINGETPLTFVHFSGYNPFKPDQISRGTSRFDLNTRPDLRPVYDLYRTRLLENKYETLIGISCAYQADGMVLVLRRIVSIGFGLQPYIPASIRILIKKIVDRLAGSKLY